MRRRGLGALALAIFVFAASAFVACDQIFDIDPGDLVVGPDATSDAPLSDGIAPNDAADAADAAAALPPYWMFTSTNFSNESEVALLMPDAATPVLMGQFTLPTGDAISCANNGRAFVINRTSGDVFLLDKENPQVLDNIATIHTAVGLDGGTEQSDPFAAIMVGDAKAYIVRYESNKMFIVDVTQVDDGGAIAPQAEIDLTVFKAGVADTDGVVDMAAGVYVPTQNRMYVALERIDQASQNCTDGALVVAIDTTSDQVFDRNKNGSVDIGDAIMLPNQNPQQMVLDSVGNRLLVAQQGCNTDGGVVGRGVDAVDLTQLEATSLVTVPNAGLYSFSQAAILYVNTTTAFVYTNTWTAWKPTSQTLGSPVSFIPIGAPFVDSSGFIVGLDNDNTADGGAPVWGVHSVKNDGTISQEVFPNVFSKVQAPDSYGLSAVLVIDEH